MLPAVALQTWGRRYEHIGGDSDTIAAIAGGVVEARSGLPQDIATQAWSSLPADMGHVIRALYRQAEEAESQAQSI